MRSNASAREQGADTPARPMPPVFAVDYTLQPEATYSEQRTQCKDALQHLVHACGHKRVMVAGDSAGQVTHKIVQNTSMHTPWY